MSAILPDVFLAGDSPHENILDIGKLGVPSHILQVVIEVLRVNHGQGQIVEDAHLLKVLVSQIAKLDIQGGLLLLWLLLFGVVKDAVVGIR